MPHFYNSPFLQKQVLGLKPDTEKHVGYMNIQPNLGIPIDAQVGFQANMAVSAFSGVDSLSRLRNGLVPMFWIQEVFTQNLLIEIS